MAVVTRTRSILESLVREGSMKWLLGGRSMFDEDFEEMGKPPSARKNWLPLLSPIANLVIRRCLSVLGIFMIELVSNFESEALDYIKHPARYARNILEFCCFQTLVLSTKVPGHLGDKKFRRLTFDMMVAWEAPSSTDFIPNEDNTAGLDAFSRIAPAIPTVSDVITCDNLFNALTAATGGRLYFSVYDKYLRGLERAIRRFKTETESSLLSVLRSRCGEKILEVDGTVTTQPVLEHVGVSTWPGRLTLTDHSLYFEEHRVVSFDKAKLYNLSEDLKQVVKPELTGPWGTRIFDRAVMYKSISLSEPVVIEFPEIKGHSRRDYWLAIIREILYAHKFIRKYQIKGVARDEALSKAVFGILRLQAIQEIAISKPICSEGLLIFNLCDQLPGGDFILETLGRMASSQDLDQPDVGSVMYSISSMAVMSNLGLMFGVSSKHANEAGLVVGEITVGEMTSLERAVRDSRNSYKEVELAQATVDGVKVEGIDTNLAVMKELLFPLMELVKYINFLASWDDPMKSLGFCSLSAYIIYRY
ncbi:hypothetical protein GIB67_012610 [Kingdonia uniflora]|uniref:Uncharacterized protein n=1 Tax=Kingdonia uniflora TaxID=39325 RepID=A0A7J7NF66_9MAGN|nr:hypothetical protein GIB67_012610 [Kingdonia uniflora]